MIGINIIEAISMLFIGLGVLLTLLAAYEAVRSKRPLSELPIVTRSQPMTTKETAEINVAFEDQAKKAQPTEREDVYEIPTEPVRAGDLLETVVIPELAYSFKFRQKRMQQNHCKA